MSVSELRICRVLGQLHPGRGQILIEAWRRHYNTVRPHSSLGYRPPAPEAGATALAALRFRFAPPAVSCGAGSNFALTVSADHSVGPGQYDT